LFNFRLKVMF